MSKVRELFEAKRAQAAAELAEAARKAHEAGKEPFDLARFEQLSGRSDQAVNEQQHRIAYYITYPEVQSLVQYASILASRESWKDSR